MAGSPRLEASEAWSGPPEALSFGVSARGHPDRPATRRGPLHVCPAPGTRAAAVPADAPERLPIARFEDCELDLERWELRRAGELVSIHRTPLRLLAYLVRNADRTLSKDELLEHVWEGTLVSDTAIASALKEVRRVLRDDGARQRVIRTCRGSGYRFVAALDTPAEPTARSRAASRRTLAVLPLESLAEDGPGVHLALGMTDALIGALARIGSLGLVSRTTVMRLRDRAISSVHDVGRELGVDLLVAGTIDHDGPRVRVCAELLDVPSEKLLWTDLYEREIGNVIELEGEVARAVERGIRRVLASAPGAGALVHTRNSPASGQARQGAAE